jgi:hypothetical protein
MGDQNPPPPAGATFTNVTGTRVGPNVVVCDVVPVGEAVAEGFAVGCVCDVVGGETVNCAVAVSPSALPVAVIV